MPAPSTYVRTPSAYERWTLAQDIPIVTGDGVDDVASLALRPWTFMGGLGAVVKLRGMEGLTGMFVVEIPPGEQLNTTRHLFEKLTYVLQGVAQLRVEDPRDGQSAVVELREGSLASVPLNASHTFVNPSGEPTRLLSFTNAPMVMDIFQDADFVFGCDRDFMDRFPAGEGELFANMSREVHQPENVWLWDTDLVEDVPNVALDIDEKKGLGVKLTQCEMSRGILVTHMADWPVGQYQKAHYHGGGATLLIVRGEGYTLLWPQSAGIHPYASGHGDQVRRVDWRVSSVMSPPDGWFHQHFNISDVPARQLAFRFGSRRRGVEFHDLRKGGGVYQSIREGGTMIEYEDEDPAISAVFNQAREEYSQGIGK